MSDTGAAKGGLTNIGEEAKPPFAVLPDPSSLFLKRSQRFAELAPGHDLEPYLAFLAHLTKAQHDIQSGLHEATLAPASEMAQALDHGMPPLRLETVSGRAGWETLQALLKALAAVEMPAQARAAAEALASVSPDMLGALAAEALGPVASSLDAAQRTLLIAALQVEASRLAAKLDAEALKPIADGVCPTCGQPAAASAVVGWRNAHNARFCVCSLCSTHWNVVRVKCVLCGETGGITYHTVEGQSDAVKAETCAKCQHYLKIAYQVDHPGLEELADDVATLALDLLMREEGWTRGGRNLFLLGY
ncbi:MAG: formate dehydrogenase accessory protein FdhE [Hyphomicrobiaceae bacterium]|nr:formate dehydrogenase accessory protein FdhE [Hyphomicrobiaceae bacterium]